MHVGQLLAVTALAATIALPGHGYAQANPDVDWASVLAQGDPHLTTNGSCPKLPGRDVCVFVNTTDAAWLSQVFGVPENTPPADGKPFFMGWAMPDAVTSGDIAGDGETDAVMEVDSGGTAGIAGFFVYRLGESSPELLDGREGFALDAYIDPDAHALYELGAVTRPCCAGGIDRLSYTLVGDRLVMQSSCRSMPTDEDLRIPQGDCVPVPR